MKRYRNFTRLFLSLKLTTLSLLTFSLLSSCTVFNFAGRFDPKKDAPTSEEHKKISKILASRKLQRKIFPGFQLGSSGVKACKLEDPKKVKELKEKYILRVFTHYGSQSIFEGEFIYKKAAFPKLKPGERIISLDDQKYIQNLIANEWYFESGAVEMVDSKTGKMVPIVNIVNEKEAKKIETLRVNNPLKMEPKLLKEEEIFEKVWDRTFTISAYSGCVNPITSEIVHKGFSSGTGWLLDYAKDETNNRYKLFLATNLHVASFLNYGGVFDPKNYLYGKDFGNTDTTAFFIGKSENPDFGQRNAQNQQLPPVIYSSAIGGEAKIFPYVYKSKIVNNPQIWSKLIKYPKIIFAAVDFMSDEGVADHKKGWVDRMKLMEDLNNHFEALPLKQTHLYHYRDFAVIELEYDEALLEKYLKEYKNDPEIVLDLKRYKEWIHKSIEEVDRTVDESKKRNFNNKNNFSNSFHEFIDNNSIISYNNLKVFEDHRDNLNYPKSSNKSDLLPLTEDLLYGGYPGNNGVSKFEYYEEGLYWKQSNHYHHDIGEKLKISGDFKKLRGSIKHTILHANLFDFRDRYMQHYGSSYVLPISLMHGSSGSSIYTREGLLNAIHWGGFTSAEVGGIQYGNREEISSSLNQVADIDISAIRYVEGADGVVRLETVKLFTDYAYNLIDDSSYPKQELSFRGALAKHYPNGVFNNGKKNTKLFDDYSKRKEK